MSTGQGQAPPCRPDTVLPLLQHQQKAPLPGDGHGQAPAPLHGGGNGGERIRSFSWITAAALTFLTFNAGMAIYRSEGDPWSVAFVLFSYCNLTLLFTCLRMYEHASAAGDHTRTDRLKVAVWLLTTTLTAAFSYKVAAIMPLPVAALVWAMAFATVAGGYYAFFVHSEK